MKRIIIALVALTALGGCGIFGGDKKPKTPVLGERLPVLNYETGAELDPGLADTAIDVPPPVANDSWAQPGGNAEHAMGHPALGTALGRAWTASIKGSSKKARLAAGPVIADGRVYVIDTEATVHAFSVANGGKVWTTRVSAAKGNESSLFGGGVSFDAGKIYATNGVGDAAALDAATGAVIWKVRPGGPLRGSPTAMSMLSARTIRFSRSRWRMAKPSGTRRRRLKPRACSAWPRPPRRRAPWSPASRRAS
jgi:hypothetical protein